MAMGVRVNQPDARGLTSFTCNNCGATTNFVATGKSVRCPFCGSEYVIARPNDPNTPQPEALVPFVVPDTQVQGIYRDWLGAGFFRPRDLTQLSTNHKMRAVYLPIWECHGYARSDWAAMAGHHYQREETYQATEDGQSVTKTRTVTETDWRPAQGHHEAPYPRELVSGSRGLAQEWVGRLGDFDYGQLQSYNPRFLLGREAEECALDLTSALQVAHQQILQHEESACAAQVPGNTHRDLRVATQVSDLAGRLLYLPVWLASFQYKDKLYRCVVNGQTGHISGEAPLSKARVALVVAAVAVAIVVIVLLITFIAAR
ncbi:MAG TPA: hypothetical protein VFW96_28305 [Thermomicrobiales bacterium]|nr:hypothetical protein [Thermomicrobiales bacterium]